MILTFFYSVARVLSDIPTVTTAVFDLSENDVAKIHCDDAVMPIIKLYPRGSKRNPVTYTGM